MAITITDKPYSVTRVGQPLIISASSTNVANSGFRFVVRIETAGSIIQDFYIAPNPAGRLMFNMMESLKNVVFTNETDFLFLPFINGSTADYLIGSYFITLFEAWEVDGLLTIDESSQVDVQAEEDETRFYLVRGSYQPSDGYRPDPNLTYGFTAGATPTTSTSLFMGNRDSNTHPLPEGLPFITFAPANYVAQPVRSSDWGFVNILSGYLGSATPLAHNLWVRYLLIKSDLTAETFSTQLTSPECSLWYLPFGPANLNQGEVGTIIPANFPDYKYYTIQLFNQDPSVVSGRQALSALYVFYPIPDDCEHDNVRLCWISPNKGGGDFFNFTKVNEESVNVERKRISKVVGDYAETSFSLDTTKGGLTELSVKPTTTLEISSDWISEGEFKLISNIVKSKAVWIINDDGTATPVVVETNSFLSERKRDGKLKRATLRLQMANENYYY